MDLDGDGVGDFLVGCFQGYPHFLKGRADGNFEAAEWLKDRAGEGIHMGQYWGIKERKWMYISQVAGVPDDNILLNPELVDWDNDGDLDLLMGGKKGSIGLRINEGSATAPEFSTVQQFVKIGDRYAKFKAQVSVAAADLDRDGKFDLVWSVYGGQLGWFPNVGTAESPVFTESRMIAGPHMDRPSVYPCVSAVDYNGDGKLDLLVGGSTTKLRHLFWIYLQK